VTFVQRSGSSRNLNVHFHVVFLDGVFARDTEGRLVFHSAAPPRPDELDRVVREVHRRALQWLARLGYRERPPLDDRTYGARPPFSLERLRVLRDGRITYRIKNHHGGRTKHRLMTPLELLARPAALVPPPQPERSRRRHPRRQ